MKNIAENDKITLVEDTCLGKGISYDETKASLEEEHILLHEYTHPAVGRISVFIQDLASIADKNIPTGE